MCRSDKELLLDYAHRGDVDALSVLVKRHETWMMAFLRAMMSHADADDAFQQVWIKVIKSVDGYRGGEVKAYLARIARSVVITQRRHIRKKTYAGVLREEESDRIDDIPDTRLSPLDTVESKSNADDVRRAVQTLPQKERDVLVLRMEFDMTLEEISRTLRRPVGTAVTQMNRAVARLKRVLGTGTFKEEKEGV